MLTLKLVLVLLVLVKCSVSETVRNFLKDKLEDAVCHAATQNYSRSCHKITSKCPSDKIPEFHQSSKWSPEIQFVCRGDDILSFRWNCQNCTSVIAYRSEDDEDSWIYLETNNCNMATLKALEPGAFYQVSVWTVGTMGDVFPPVSGQWENTTTKTSTPLEVKRLLVKELTLKKDEFQYEVVLTWQPAEDLPCHYEFVIFNGGSNYKQLEVRDPADLYEIRIKGLDFGLNYSIAIMAKSTDWTRESPKTWIYFSTPTCIQSYRNLTICPPSPPAGLKVKEVFNDEATDQNPLYDVQVEWEKPDLLPDYYTIELTVISPNRSKTVSNVSGELTSTTISKVFVGLQYQIGIAAFSKAGPSQKSHFFQQWVQATRPPAALKNTWSATNITILTIGLFSLLILMIVGIVFLSRQCAKKDRIEKRCQYFQELEEKSPEYIDTITETLHDDVRDKWEIDIDCLSLGTTLGKGAFGVVRKGWLKTQDGNNKEVAVKMLQECPSIEDKRHFLQEIDIMKSVGNHKHLVSLIGCCIAKQTAPLLIVEYCSRGDLKTYLQNAWEAITNQNFEIQYAQLVDTNGTEMVMNKTYYLQGDNILQPQDLLSFARQISIGMEYLSSLHVLHRDLAARNVLVCEDRTVKVSDFGLSRDVYRDNVYYKSGSGKLPIRWMALESLTHQVYTVQSDIWSFGILLWEIVTLGGNPYPGISTQDLPKFLESGQRMEKPANCSNDLYNLMQNCWKKAPKDRPSFTDIRNTLDKLLENVSDYLHLGVSVCREMNSFRCQKSSKNKKITTSERYVRPITVHR